MLAHRLTKRRGMGICVINAATGQVNSDQIHTSGNATYQELWILKSRINAK